MVFLPLCSCSWPLPVKRLQNISTAAVDAAWGKYDNLPWINDDALPPSLSNNP